MLLKETVTGRIKSGSKGISRRMSKMRFYPKDSEKSMETAITTNTGTV
jgi:hypothetical protein